LRLTNTYAVEVFGSGDAVEGASAFAEKRSPNWRADRASVIVGVITPTSTVADAHGDSHASGSTARGADGTSVDTIRFYQKRRLLDPPRRDGRIAWYGPEHRERSRASRAAVARPALALIGGSCAVELDPSDAPLAAAVAAATPATRPGVPHSRRARGAHEHARGLLRTVGAEGLLVRASTKAKSPVHRERRAVVAAGLELLAPDCDDRRAGPRREPTRARVPPRRKPSPCSTRTFARRCATATSTTTRRRKRLVDRVPCDAAASRARRAPLPPRALLWPRTPPSRLATRVRSRRSPSRPRGASKARDDAGDTSRAARARRQKRRRSRRCSTASRRAIRPHDRSSPSGSTWLARSPCAARARPGSTVIDLACGPATSDELARPVSRRWYRLLGRPCSRRHHLGPTRARACAPPRRRRFVDGVTCGFALRTSPRSTVLRLARGRLRPRTARGARCGRNALRVPAGRALALLPSRSCRSSAGC